jgi:undecaprenyl-diphosphatase
MVPRYHVFFPLMSLLQLVTLAIVQGLTEFLPISSSAHLALAPWLFGWEDQGLTFDIALHFGTLLAVLVYFFRDWLQVVAQGFGLHWGTDQELSRQPRLLWWLVAASIPVGVVGWLFQKKAEAEWRSPWIIGTMLVSVGLLMLVAERVGRQTKRIETMSLLDALLIGVSQALAVVPGTSRSGITITTGLFRDLERAAAARFSFFLMTPTIAGAAAKAFLDLRKHGGIPPGTQTEFLLGVAISAVTGLAVISFFLRYLRTNTLKLFIYYRIIFGLFVLALAFWKGR